MDTEINATINNIKACNRDAQYSFCVKFIKNDHPGGKANTKTNIATINAIKYGAIGGDSILKI